MEQVLEVVFHVRPRDALGLRLRLGDEDVTSVNNVRVSHDAADTRGLLAEYRQLPLYLRRRQEVHGYLEGRVAGDPTRRFLANGPNPYRRMRLLVWARPHVDAVVVVVRALVREQILSPRAQDDLDGFVETCPRLVDRYAVDQRLARDAADEAGDQAATRDRVQHRQLLGYAQWVTVDRQQVAEHRQLDVLC